MAKTKTKSRKSVQPSVGIVTDAKTPETITIRANELLNLTIQGMELDHIDDAVCSILAVSQKILALPGTDCLWLYVDGDAIDPDRNSITVERDETEQTLKVKLHAAIEEGADRIVDFAW